MSAGAERAQMVLDAYDPDDRDRLVRLLADLSDWCAENTRAPIDTIAVYARQMAESRRHDLPPGGGPKHRIR